VPRPYLQQQQQQQRAHATWRRDEHKRVLNFVCRLHTIA
jgi:hypothetical protein